MTKQEERYIIGKQKEADRILTKYTGRTGEHLDIVKRELSKAGVVIKGREPPYWLIGYNFKPLIGEK